MPDRSRADPTPTEVDRALHDKEGWPEYRRLVLAKLDDLKQEVREVDAKVEAVRGDVVSLKIKAAGWGFVAGSITAIGGLLIQYLTRGGGH